MSRSFQKDHQMGHPALCESYFQSDPIKQNQKPNSFFSVPGLFIGFNSKGVADCDSVRSPTSPLDVKAFSKSPYDRHHKSWDCSKVGLSIVDSLDDEKKRPNFKSIIIGHQMRIGDKPFNFCDRIDFIEKPKSLPKNYVVSNQAHIKSSNLTNESVGSLFEIGDGLVENELIGNIRSCSVDSGRRFSTFNSFAHCNHTSGCRNFCSPSQLKSASPNFDNSLSTFNTEVPFRCSSNNFLSFCYSCKKKLDGIDIYIYRGEKAFCSFICREQEILFDGGLEETMEYLPESLPEDTYP